jgi:hypothetical protein
MAVMKDHKLRGLLSLDLFRSIVSIVSTFRLSLLDFTRLIQVMFSTPGVTFHACLANCDRLAP